METPRGRGAAVSGSNLAGKREHPEDNVDARTSQAIVNDPWIVDLTAQIRSEHEAVVGSFRSGLAHAVKNLEAARLTATEMTAGSVASYDAALAAMRGES
jgi:hypothetical protein